MTGPEKIWSKVPKREINLFDIDRYYEVEKWSYDPAIAYAQAHFTWFAKKHNPETIDGDEAGLLAIRNEKAWEAAEIAWSNGDIQLAQHYESLIIAPPAQTDSFEPHLDLETV